MEMNKTGTNKLAERIIADANALAEQTLTEANAGAMEIAAENVQKQNAVRADFQQKREAAVQSVLDGCKTRAAIDGKKAALQKKRAVIDAVFEEAYRALCALNGGFLLIGRGYEKDCSFRAVLSQLRDEEETAVANLLFN